MRKIIIGKINSHNFELDLNKYLHLYKSENKLINSIQYKIARNALPCFVYRKEQSFCNIKARLQIF